MDGPSDLRPRLPEGTVSLLADLRDPDTVDEETLRMAADSCPTNAIDIEAEDDIWSGRAPA